MVVTKNQQLANFGIDRLTHGRPSILKRGISIWRYMNDDLCLSVHCMHISTQELGGLWVCLPSPFPETFYQLDVLRLLCRPFLDQKSISLHMLGCSLTLYNDIW